VGYEKLTYQIIQEQDGYELRLYDPYVLMKVRGESNQGFGVLFNYISGNNSKRQKIQMTVPVVTDVSSSEYIAFTMPKSVQENYPEPMQSNVEIVKIPEKLYLAKHYKGSPRQAMKVYESLLNYAEEKHIQLKGEPILLRYQGPFMPNLFKDNEVLVEIQK